MERRSKSMMRLSEQLEKHKGKKLVNRSNILSSTGDELAKSIVEKLEA